MTRRLSRAGYRSGLPDIDGLTLHDCLQNTNCEFPVVCCTGQDLDERIRNIVSASGAVVLPKPVSAGTLLTTVGELCAKTKRP